REIAAYEKQIEELEAEIKRLETILITPEGASNADLLWQHAELQKKLSDTMDKWAEAAEKKIH
ncbi:MAG: hypothetical protein LBR13_00480, partial [Dysgonamonadaceae bacterium]|nr:hypothetical protein [Dysgonamonadaceae bacterium]